MMNVIFHIGIPKTGSTALQVFLARNSNSLRQRSVDYFDVGETALGRAGRISSGNGAYLARSVLPIHNPARMPDPDGAIQDFLTAVKQSDCEQGLVSSELFVDAESDLFANLLDRVRALGACPKVFYLIREQDQFISSSYIQQVKRHGLTKEPEEFGRQAFKNIPYLHYYTWLQKMERLFGPGNVLCRTYEGAMHSANGICGTLCAALEIDDAGLDLITQDINTGMSLHELAIMRRLNKYLPRMRFSDLVVENAQLSGAVRAGDYYEFLSSDLREEIAAFFKDENRAIANYYFKRDELFFVKAKKESGSRQLNAEIDLESVIDFAGGLLVRFDERLATIEAKLGALVTRVGNLERH